MSSGVAEHVVAVVGAGTMGRGIAEVAAVAGHRVLLYDAIPGAAAAAAAAVRASVERRVARGRLPAGTAEELDLVVAGELDELAPATIVIEAIIEDLEAKHDLFGRLESVVGQETILATNTSSLSPTAIAAGLSRTSRVAGMHFFNPVPVMRLVEVIAGHETAPETVDTIVALARAWGKEPVRCLARPGFIVNRVARPFYAEAWRLVEERATDPRTVDTVLTGGGGFRMGPFALMDLIGHDTNQAVTRSVWSAFGNDPRFAPSRLQAEYVLAGWLGRKSERGVLWPDESPAPGAPATSIRPTRITVRAGSDLEALVRRAAHQDVQVAESLDADAVLNDRLRLVVTDGRTAAELADAWSAPVVIVDRVLDPAVASDIAIAFSGDGDDDQRDAAIGLFQAAGLRVHPIADVPGLIVGRTVAMLANVAFDAAAEGLSSAQEIDEAMRSGTGYPLGPIAWAERWGHSWASRVLAGLHDYYADPRYRPTPQLRPGNPALRTPAL